MLIICANCNGLGWFVDPESKPNPLDATTAQVVCEECQGTGEVEEQ